MKSGVLAVTIVPLQVREAALAYSLRDEIIALVESSRTQDLVLDFRNLQFIGSIGFLAFLGVWRHLGGGRIVICNLAPAVRKMFTVCQLISTDGVKAAPFEAEESLEVALARLVA